MGVQYECAPHIEQSIGCCEGRVHFVCAYGSEGALSDRAHTNLTCCSNGGLERFIKIA